MGEYLDPEALVAMMQTLEIGKDLLVVDVRDLDRDDGWIRGSTHLPSNTLDADAMEAFARQHVAPAGVKACVFHCFYSQVRGPRAYQLFRMVSPRVYTAESGSNMPQLFILRGGWVGFSTYARTTQGVAGLLEAPQDSGRASHGSSQSGGGGGGGGGKCLMS